MIKLINSIFILLLSTTFALAQTASILPPGKTTFFDNGGKPLAGGKVQFYIPGTTTPKMTWQDAAQTIPNTNPVTLDSAGRAIIYGSGSYQQVVRDAANNIIWNVQTASGGSGGGGGTTPTVGDGQPVGSMQIWTGFAAPSQYAFAYGQEFVRASFPELFAALTSQQNVSCTSGSPTLTGIGNTEQLPVGAKIESTCLNPGATIISKTVSTVTASTNAIISTTTSARFFPWGNGDGNLTANLPDMRGRVPAGRDNMGGIAANRLTATYYGTAANGLAVPGGSESQQLTQAQLPNVQLPVNTSGTVTVTSANQILSSNAQTSPFTLVNGAGSNLNAFAGGTTQVVTFQNSSGVNSMTGTTGAMGSNAAHPNVQPSVTANYVVKTTPDSNANSFFGVASIGGMQGVILCGQGVSCSGNTISALTAALAPPSTLALGGIFQSNAPTNQFAIGVDLAGNLIYAGGATTVNGQVCTIGGSCTISASAGTITVGTTNITGAAANGLLFNNGGVLGSVTSANNGLVVTNGSGLPNVSTANAVSNTLLAQSPAATLKGNPTSGTTNVQDFSIQALTNKPSPDPNNDRLVLYDQSTGTLKNCTVGQCGSAGVSGVSSYNGLTGAVVAPSSDKTIYLSTSGNDSNNGLSPETAKLTPQAAITAAVGGGTVFAGAGTFTLNSNLLMQPNVKLQCSPGTIITQGNGANLTAMIDFATNSANNSTITGCTIDGNRANNNDVDGIFNVYIGTANYVTIENNKIYNSTGDAVGVSEGTYPIVRFNDIQNYRRMGISVGTGNPFVNTYGQFNSNTFSNQTGQHVIYIVRSNYNRVYGNFIQGTQFLGNATAVAPDKINWVSGTDFTNLKSGGFIVQSPGGSLKEYHIIAVNSNTQVTVTGPVTPATNIPFVGGTGDLINVSSSIQTEIGNNVLSGGSSGGIVIHNFIGGQYSYETNIMNNSLYAIGSSAIAVQGVATSPVTNVNSVTIQGNNIFSAGQGYLACTAACQAGITITDFAPTSIDGVVINGNRIENNFLGSTMAYGIILSGVTAGRVFSGNNTNRYITNGTIQNGISATLGAGFGSSASVTASSTSGNTFQISVNPSGSGIAANPVITVNTFASSLTQPPMMNCKAYNNNGTQIGVLSDITAGATASAIVLTLQTTPTGGVPINIGCNG